MEKITLKHEKTFETFDVVILGGGTFSVGLAIRLSKKKIKVAIVERRTKLAWEITSALRVFVSAHTNFSPVANEILDLVRSRNGYKDGVFEPWVVEIATEKILKNYGVKIYYFSWATKLIKEDNTVCGVEIYNSSGYQILLGKFIVDNTQETKIATSGGIRLVKNDNDFIFRSFVMNNVQISENQEINVPFPVKNNKIHIRPTLWKGEVNVSFVTKAREESFLLSFKIASYLKEKIPEFKDSFLSQVSFEPFVFPSSKIVSKGRKIQIFEIFDKKISITKFVPKKLKGYIVGPYLANLDRQTKDLLLDFAPTIKLAENIGDWIYKNLPEKNVIPQIPLYENLEELPILKKVDVLVAGGGTAGTFAAISAKKHNASVCLIEPNECLGGTVTAGIVHSYCWGSKSGSLEEIDTLTKDVAKKVFYEVKSTKWFHPDAKKYVFLKIAKESGIQLFLRSVATLPVLKNSAIKGVVVETPEKTGIILAKVIIDSTADGEIVAKSGVNYFYGRQKDGFAQPYSMPAMGLHQNNRLKYINVDAGWVDVRYGNDITRAYIDGKEYYWDNVEDFDNKKCRIMYIAPFIGIRESRHTLGEYVLTLDDLLNSRTFPDRVGECYSFYDNHAEDFTNEDYFVQIWVNILGLFNKPLFCEVPYGCLLPKGIENLLVASRSASFTHDAQTALRMERDIHKIGEAAGVIAAIASKRNLKLREVLIEEVQKILTKNNFFQLNIKHKNETKQLTEDEIIQKLNNTENLSSLWELIQMKEKIIPQLKNLLNSTNDVVRLNSATCLAILKQKEAIPELISCLNRRIDWKPKGHKAQPRWLAAIILLGYLCDEKSLHPLVEILYSRELDTITALYVLRAIENIYEHSLEKEKYVEMIKDGINSVLKKSELGKNWALQLSGGARKPVRVDIDWYIHIICGSILVKLGDYSSYDILKRVYHSTRYAPVREFIKRLNILVWQK